MNNFTLKKNISWLFFDKVIRTLGGLFVGIWVARYLGPEGFGLLSYAMAYCALFFVFVNLGLDQIVVRELVKFPNQRNEILGTAFLLKISGALVGILVISLSFFLVELGSLTRVVISILSLSFIVQSLDVIDYHFQAKIMSKYVVIARNCAFFVSSILKIYLILEEYSVTYFAIANLLDTVLFSGFLMFMFMKTKNPICKWKFRFQTAKILLTACWPLAFSGFLITIHMRIDQIMIGNMLTTTQVGIYSVAVKLSESWYFFPGIIVNTLMPYFVNLKTENSDLYYVKLTQLYSLMFWMGIGVGCIFTVWGKKIIILLFGAEYLNAYWALIFNIWNGIFVSQAVARGIWLVNEDLQRYRLYNNLIIVIFNIALNVSLIPLLGISGAAIATLFTQCAGTWVLPFFWEPLRCSTFEMIKSINPVYLIRGMKFG